MQRFRSRRRRVAAMLLPTWAAKQALGFPDVGTVLTSK